MIGWINERIDRYRKGKVVCGPVNEKLVFIALLLPKIERGSSFNSTPHVVPGAIIHTSKSIHVGYLSCFPAFLPTYLPVYLSIPLNYLPTYLSSCPSRLATRLPSYPPFSFFLKSYLSTYLTYLTYLIYLTLSHLICLTYLTLSGGRLLG